jgi:hypothetical protein
MSLETLRAVLDRLIAADEYPSATDAGVLEYLLRHGEGDLASGWQRLQTGLQDLDVEARSRCGSPFASLGGPNRRRGLAALVGRPPRLL